MKITSPQHPSNFRARAATDPESHRRLSRKANLGNGNARKRGPRPWELLGIDRTTWYWRQKNPGRDQQPNRGPSVGKAARRAKARQLRRAA